MTTEKIKFAFFDFDGTLVQKPQMIMGNWDQDLFIEKSKTCAPIATTVHQVQDLAKQGFRIVFITSRQERYREVTNRRIQSLINTDPENPVGYNLFMCSDAMGDKLETVTKGLVEAGNPDEAIEQLLYGHAAFRDIIVNGIVDMYEDLDDLTGSVAFDDQYRNLETLHSLGAECWVVQSDGNLHEFLESDK